MANNVGLYALLAIGAAVWVGTRKPKEEGDTQPQNGGAQAPVTYPPSVAIGEPIPWLQPGAPALPVSKKSAVQPVKTVWDGPPPINIAEAKARAAKNEEHFQEWNAAYEDSERLRKINERNALDEEVHNRYEERKRTGTLSNMHVQRAGFN